MEVEGYFLYLHTCSSSGQSSRHVAARGVVLWYTALFALPIGIRLLMSRNIAIASGNIQLNNQIQYYYYKDGKEESIALVCLPTLIPYYLHRQKLNDLYFCLIKSLNEIY